MKSCELCGAENEDKDIHCCRCGFEFPRVISSDVRDEAILKKYGGKSVDEVKRDLNNRQTQLKSFLENMDAKQLKREELIILLDEALGFLKVPIILGVEDELIFNKNEEEFIKLMMRILDKADRDHGGPISTVGTYIKLANALQSMNQLEKSMEIIEKALLINPQNQDAMFGKAKLLFYSKNYASAKKCLEKLIEKGEHPKARYLVELIDQIQ